MPPPGNVVTVEIFGQSYPIRSALDEAYVVELAAIVDQRMRVAADAVPDGDVVRLAILAALNIADELSRCRADQDTSHGTVVERAARIERILDAALAS
jgi:cell division protein ZapA